MIGSDRAGDNPRAAAEAQACEGGVGAGCGETMPHHQIQTERVDIMRVLNRKPKLLHFGLDYLVLMVGSDEKEGGSIKFLDAIFSFPHNDSNASEICNLVWGNSDEEVNVHFANMQNDEIAFVFRGEEKILSIQNIGLTSTMPAPIKRKYQYRISFYSAFFSLVRLKEFAYRDYWELFLWDIEASAIRHSVSRIDICADLADISINGIRNEIAIHGKLIKKPSLINIDLVTKEPETFYFGEQSRHWKARIYNKIVEVNKKGKERLYPDYFFYDLVTRLEIELRSRSCQTFKINLLRCLDIELLFGVYKAHLQNKSATWHIVHFIENEFKKMGFKSINPERRTFDYGKMSDQKFFKMTLRKNMKCAKRYGVDVEEMLEWMKKMAKHIPITKI